MLVVNPEILETLPVRRISNALQKIPIDSVNLLPRTDRLLVELYLRQSLTCRQIADALGRSPGAVSRRIRTLLVRLRNPLVQALADPQCTLPPRLRRVGIEHFLLGKSVSLLAGRQEMSLDRVRAALNYIRGWQAAER